MHYLTRLVNPKNSFVVTSLTAFCVSLGYILAPRLVLSLYGITPADRWGVLALQAYGSLVLFWGLVSWFARNSPDSEARRAIIRALFIGFTVAIIAPVMTIYWGVGNWLFWVVAISHALLALAWGYVYVAYSGEAAGSVPGRQPEPVSD